MIGENTYLGLCLILNKGDGGNKGDGRDEGLIFAIGICDWCNSGELPISGRDKQV